MPADRGEGGVIELGPVVPQLRMDLWPHWLHEALDATGSGKTLPGLLIGEWVRRKGEGPVIYATPTKQLARQVLATAQREGVDGVLLVDGYRSWDTADESAVEGAEATASLRTVPSSTAVPSCPSRGS